MSIQPKQILGSLAAGAAAFLATNTVAPSNRGAQAGATLATAAIAFFFLGSKEEEKGARGNYMEMAPIRFKPKSPLPKKEVQNEQNPPPEGDRVGRCRQWVNDHVREAAEQPPANESYRGVLDIGGDAAPKAQEVHHNPQPKAAEQKAGGQLNVEAALKAIFSHRVDSEGTGKGNVTIHNDENFTASGVRAITGAYNIPA